MAVQIVTSLRDRGGQVVRESYADQGDGTHALVLATVAGGAGDRFVNIGRDRGGLPIVERYADQGDTTFARVVSLVGGGGGGGMTNPMTTLGDLITGGAAGAPSRLGVSTNGFLLTLVGGVPAWAAMAPAAAGTLTGATLAGTVLASSLTSVGILASPHMTSPVVDSGGLTVTLGGIAITGASSLTGVATAGGANLLTLTPGAHTAVTSEFTNLYKLGQTYAITGSFATERLVRFGQATFTSAGANTIATAATLAIDNAPAPGGSALITRPLALWVQNGQVGIDSNSGLSTATTANVGPALALTGTWITGGNTTTNKPHVLIEPAGTTSAAWSVNGTALGINAGSGMSGALLDLQQAANPLFSVYGVTTSASGYVVSNVGFTVTNIRNVNRASLISATQSAAATGNIALLIATAGAHTGQTIAEEVDVSFNLARTITFVTGAGTVANQRSFRITAPTLAAGTAGTTFTQAATLAVSGPPTASTNVVFTNTPAAIWVESGLLLTAASVVGSSGFRLPHGVAPTTPVNGDVWTTSAGMFTYINGATKTVTLT